MFFAVDNMKLRPTPRHVYCEYTPGDILTEGLLRNFNCSTVQSRYVFCKALLNFSSLLCRLYTPNPYSCERHSFLAEPPRIVHYRAGALKRCKLFKINNWNWIWISLKVIIILYATQLGPFSVKGAKM